MREIKFRAYDKTENRMIEWFQRVFTKINNTIQLCEYPLKNMDSSYLEYMQYTGLKDIYGKEIYEGDILKSSSGHVYEIIFDTGCFSGDSNKMMFISASCFEDGEVIGNIFENPDKLNK